MPESLQQKFAELLADYQRLRERPDPAVADRLKGNAQLLQGMLSTLDLKAQDLAKEGAAREKALEAIEKQVQLEPAVELQQFLTQVSTALIQAQKELNEESLAYAEGLDARIPASYFAIPSLKAEMRLGFSEVSAKGVNVIFFNRQEQKQRYGESVVTFELVSAPPPPGQETLRAAPQFLLVGDERRQFLGRLRSAAAARAETAIDEKVYGPTEDLAVVVRHVRPVGKERRFLALWPGRPLGAAENWSEFRVLAVEEQRGELSLNLDGCVRIPTIGELTAQTADKWLELVRSLGNVWLDIVVAVNRWLATPGALMALPLVAGGAEGARLLELMRKAAAEKKPVPAEYGFPAHYQNLEGLAVVFRFHQPLPSQPQRYLVLWPSSSEPNGPLEQWEGFGGFCVRVAGNELTLDRSIFTASRAPAAEYAGIPPGKVLEKWKAEKPTSLFNLIDNIGDVLMNVVLLVREWV